MKKTVIEVDKLEEMYRELLDEEKSRIEVGAHAQTEYMRSNLLGQAIVNGAIAAWLRQVLDQSNTIEYETGNFANDSDSAKVFGLDRQV